MNPVIHVAADLGQGGTERSIELLATAAEGPSGQRVVAIDRDGPTGERLRAAGIPVQVFGGCRGKSRMVTPSRWRSRGASGGWPKSVA